MILFEANAEAPLVKLPDAAVGERVQIGNGRANGDYARRKAPTAKSSTLATARMGHPTSKAQLQSSNFKGGENRGSAKASELSRILAPGAGRCGKGAARKANRVYNAGNLLQGPNYYKR
jgi:hypothetical protein